MRFRKGTVLLPDPCGAAQPVGPSMYMYNVGRFHHVPNISVNAFYRSEEAARGADSTWPHPGAFKVYERRTGVSSRLSMSYLMLRLKIKYGSGIHPSLETPGFKLSYSGFGPDLHVRRYTPLLVGKAAVGKQRHPDRIQHREHAAPRRSSRRHAHQTYTTNKVALSKQGTKAGRRGAV